jgi:hypothetical protein
MRSWTARQPEPLAGGYMIKMIWSPGTTKAGSSPLCHKQYSRCNSPNLSVLNRSFFGFQSRRSAQFETMPDAIAFYRIRR